MATYTSVNWNTDRTDAEWDALADELQASMKAEYERAHESFERCDTDGFVSQWASRLGGDADGAAVELCKRRGLTTVSVLLDAETGEIASTHHAWGQYGAYWVLNDAAAEKAGKRFVNESRASKQATFVKNMLAKGFKVGTAEVRAEVKIVGGGTGLSGAVNCRAAVVPLVSRLKANDVKIVDTELPPWAPLVFDN